MPVKKITFKKHPDAILAIQLECASRVDVFRNGQIEETNQGWFVDADKWTGEPMQVQCEFCCTTPDSKFNLANAPANLPPVVGV
jgi:hypothetical protein